ncbi:MAG: CHAD domain-containing protein [Clostridiaceae bacterium]
MKKDKKIAKKTRKKTNIIRDFKEIAHDIFSEEDSLLLKLEKLKRTKSNGKIDEVELIHDLRVNIRRLISLLYFYRPLLKKNERKVMIEELNLLLKSFGTQRTYDILQKSVLKYADTLKDEEEKGEEVKKTLLSLIKKSIKNGDFERKKSKKLTPDDPKFNSIYEYVYLKLIESDVELFKIKKSEKIKNLHQFKEKRIQKLMRTLKEKEREVDLSKVKEIHALRILGKNMFYTVNSFDEEFGGAYKDFLGHLQKIQDVGGNIHDADVNLSMMSNVNINKEKNSMIKDFMSFLESEKAEKIDEFKKILEEKFDK